MLDITLSPEESAALEAPYIQASVDLVYSSESNKDLVERIESRHGLRQLSAMRELKMGNSRYELIDVTAEA